MATAERAPEIPLLPDLEEPELIPGHGDFARHLKRFFANDEDRAQRAVDSYLRRHKGEEIDPAKMFEDLTKHKGKPKSHAEGKRPEAPKRRKIHKHKLDRKR